MAEWWVEYFREVTLSVPPELGASVGLLNFNQGSILSIPPEIIIDGAGNSFAEALLSISPEIIIGMPKKAATVISVPPEMIVSGIPNMNCSVTLSIPPEISILGGGQSVASTMLSISPEMAVSGTGTNGASNVLVDVISGLESQVYNTGASFTITLTQTCYVMVDIIGTYDVSAPATVPTCGGTAMTLIGSQKNGSTAPTVFRYVLAGVSPGTKTITYGQVLGYSLGVAVALTGVVSLGTTVGTNGSNTTPSQSVSCAFGELIIHSIGIGNANFGSAVGPSRIYTKDDSGAGVAVASSSSSATFGNSTSLIEWSSLATVFKPTI